MKYLLVGIGELLWDLLPSGKQLGGAPTNFAYHVNRLGGEAVIISRVGKDELGEEILLRLEALGLTSRFISTDEDHPTGTVSVKLDQEGTPSFTIEEEVAWDYLTEDQNLRSLASRTDAVCFGTLAQRSPAASRAIGNFLRNTSESALRIFDLNLRPPHYSREIIQKSLKLANILKLNAGELAFLADLFELSGDPISQISRIAERFDLRVVALTRGSRGSLLWLDGQHSENDGNTVEVVDTVGAGDAYTAAMALGLLKGLELERINQIANRVASYICTCRGATPSIPTDFQRFF